MGCWAIGGQWRLVDLPAGWGEVDDAESIRAIHYALDHGITFFDTAANYGAGHSEHILGKALAGRRDQAVISTKFGFKVDEAAKRVTRHERDEDVIKNVRAECEASLRRLNTDVIDLNFGDRIERAPLSELREWATMNGARVADPDTPELPTGVTVRVSGEHVPKALFIDTPGAGGLDRAAIDVALERARGAGVLLMVYLGSAPSRSVCAGPEGEPTWYDLKRLPWSEMVQDLPSLLPLLLDDTRPGIIYGEYHAAPDGTMQLRFA